MSKESPRWGIHLKLSETEAAFSPEVQAVRDLITRYAGYIDSGNAERLRTICTPNCQLDVVHFHRRYKGIDNVIGFYAGNPEKKRESIFVPETMQHHVSNQLVKISKGGNEAHATAQYLANAVLRKGALSIWSGLYAFHMKKIDGRWKIIDFKIDRVFDIELPNVRQRGSSFETPSKSRNR